MTGNPVKFGLSNVSIIFDIIFMLQHYVLYRHPQKSIDNGEDLEDNGNAWESERLVSARTD